MKKQKKLSNVIAAIMTKELQISAKSAGSHWAYQPKTPEGLKRFRK
ncbi:MAG: cyclic lactone autoinducer peptide [Lachnospiraceae bacterium]|nr:cyclic lactone autoinducer peptide [Lachnospiraceae bacterium]